MSILTGFISLVLFCVALFLFYATVQHVIRKNKHEELIGSIAFIVTLFISLELVGA